MVEQTFDLKYWYLRDHKLFRTLNSSDLKQLCIVAGFKKAKKDELLYFSDEEPPRVYFLKKGAVKIIEVNEEGHERVKEIIQKGDLFGELYFENDRTKDEIAKVATNEVIICSFLLTDFEDLMLRKPEFGLNYTKFLGLKFKKLRNNYSNLINKAAKDRLKIFLLEWIESDGIKKQEAIYIDNYLTQEDIAQIICTSRQTTTTLFNSLEHLGIISYNRKQIIIKDLDKLKQF